MKIRLLFLLPIAATLLNVFTLKTNEQKNAFAEPISNKSDFENLTTKTSLNLTYNISETEPKYSICKTPAGANLIGLRFSGIIPVSIYNSIIESHPTGVYFGITYQIGTNLPATQYIYNGVFVNDPNDKSGIPQTDPNANYFRYSIVIKEIPDAAFSTEITSFAFFSEGTSPDDYHEEMNSAKYSVNTIAQEYLKDPTIAAGPHAGVLTWLSTYHG